MDKLFNRQHQVALRRELRHRASTAEALLWARLRGSQLGAKFRRQHGIGLFVVDFYCPSARLAVELDGDSHDSEKSLASDAARQTWIEALGIRVLRFRNDDVFSDLEAVLGTIQGMLC